MLFNDVQLSKLRPFVEKYTGIYSKKGCIETASDIGRELIDFQKAGKNITVPDFLSCIKTKAPHVKLPDIAKGDDELISLMQKNGLDELCQKRQLKWLSVFESILGFFDKDIKGIYVRKNLDVQTRLPGIFAHEFEHYIEYYNNPQTVIKNIIKKLKPERIIRDKHNKDRVQHILNSPRKEELIEAELNKVKRNIRCSLSKDFDIGFGLRKESGIIPQSGIIEGYPSTVEGVEEFFKSKNFTGLTSPKRIDAYIRAIIRHHANPKNTSPMILEDMQTSFMRESTAYQVNDNISRYASDNDNLTAYKIISEIYRRAGRIMDNEIKIAKKCKRQKVRHELLESIYGKRAEKAPDNPKRLGLPTSAVV